MELVPWEPFGEVSPFRREMDKLWDKFFGERPFGRWLTSEWSPSVDISETDEAFIIKAELPGLDVKDVSVTISGDVLSIKGEKKKEEEEKDAHHYCMERYQGSFQRVFRLPASVMSERVDATFDKGILHITVPKAEEAKKKAIKVNVK